MVVSFYIANKRSTIQVTRGDTPRIDFVFTKISDGSPVDISDYDLFFMAKLSLDDEDEDAIANADMTLDEGEEGKCHVILKKSDTATAGNFYGEIEARKESSPPEVKTLAEFNYIIEKDVRRGE